MTFIIAFFSGKGKFYVVFGVGSSKYRTDAVADPEGNPEWFEECVM